jgi:uncharacterized membrane protein YeiH
MPGIPFLLPLEFDLVATFLAALTGVWAAHHRGYDLVGAVVLGFVCGVGGGLLRDCVFLRQIPVVMQDARYLWAVLAALPVGLATLRFEQRFIHMFAYTDAIAMGVYGVYGANRSLIAGLSPEAAIVVGMCNAVGGGLIRDVLVREEPLLFKPGQLYVLAGLGGCIAFVVLTHQYGFDTNNAAYGSIALTLLLRLAAIRFDWKTRSLKDRYWRPEGK